MGGGGGMAGPGVAGPAAGAGAASLAAGGAGRPSMSGAEEGGEWRHGRQSVEGLPAEVQVRVGRVEGGLGVGWSRAGAIGLAWAECCKV